MNRPDSRTMVLGHPVIATPVGLAGLAALAVCFEGGAVVPGLLSLAMMVATGQAVERRKSFLAWQREWNALDPNGVEPRWKPGTRPGLVLGILLPLGGLILSVQDRATNMAVLGLVCLLGLLTAAIVVIYWLWYRFRSRRARRGMVPVTVIARPLFAVLPLPQAYAALPDHCQRILTGQAS